MNWVRSGFVSVGLANLIAVSIALAQHTIEDPRALGVLSSWLKEVESGSALSDPLSQSERDAVHPYPPPRNPIGAEVYNCAVLLWPDSKMEAAFAGVMGKDNDTWLWTAEVNVVYGSAERSPKLTYDGEPAPRSLKSAKVGMGLSAHDPSKDDQGWRSANISVDIHECSLRGAVFW